MQSFEDHLEKLGLTNAPVVHKFGGSTASNIKPGVDYLRREMDLKPTAAVLSAFRIGNLQMTTQLLAMSEQLDIGKIEEVECLIETMRDQMQMLLGQGGPVSNPFIRFQMLLQRIRMGETHWVDENDCDRKLWFSDTSCSIPCIGEHGSVLEYEKRLNEIETHSGDNEQQCAAAFPIDEYEHAIRSLPETDQQEFTYDLLCEFLQQSNRDKMLSLIPGYLPHNATDRGYSDVTAVDASLAMRTVTGKQTVCSVDKEFPVYPKNPDNGHDASPLDRLSYAEAHAACDIDGFAPGVVHPRAIKRAEQHGIPILVHNPFDPGLGATLIQ